MSSKPRLDISASRQQGREQADAIARRAAQPSRVTLAKTVTGPETAHPFQNLGTGYKAILADPPWQYRVRSEKGKARSADTHYDCMSLDEICALPVAGLAAKSCHLFMWCTGPTLVAGQPQQVCRAWGFEPSSMAFVWIKCKKGQEQGSLWFTLDESAFVKGMGHTTRQNAEFVLLGRRGAPKRLDKSIHQIVVAPRREHSRKPDVVHERIETYATGPYLELFARAPRSGWDIWGNQTDRFVEVASA